MPLGGSTTPPAEGEETSVGEAKPSPSGPALADDVGHPAIPVYEEPLAPINGVVAELVQHGEEVDFSRPGVVRISKRPKMGTEAYAVLLFSAIAEETITRYEEIHSVSIPGLYRHVLSATSGAFLFDLSLYGVPPSMAQDPPLLDRSQVWPLDLATANRLWRVGFTQDPDGFHFGGSPWDTHENVGYFLFADGSVRALLKGNQPAGDWASLEEFLEKELERCRLLYPEREEHWARLLVETEPRPKRATRHPSAGE